MPSQSAELRERTKQFAIRIVKLFHALPRAEEARVLGKQVLRSGTSVAANYRAVCRSRSRADFISKIAVVTEEADETVCWLELLVESGIVPKSPIGEAVDGSKRVNSNFWFLSSHGKI
jgi:four helix bundle protein